MSGSSLTLCLLVGGREQSRTTHFWIRPSSPPSLLAGWRGGFRFEGGARWSLLEGRREKKGLTGSWFGQQGHYCLSVCAWAEQSKGGWCEWWLETGLMEASATIEREKRALICPVIMRVKRCTCRVSIIKPLEMQTHRLCNQDGDVGVSVQLGDTTKINSNIPAALWHTYKYQDVANMGDEDKSLPAVQNLS